MGPTREKKPSKKSLKASQQASDIATKLNKSESSTSLTPQADSILSIEPSNTSDLLVVPKPSAKSSRSSLRTDRSAASTSSDALSSPSSPFQAYDPSLIEVVSTPDRGYAIYTTSRIPAGTLILAEKPIIRLTAAEETSSSVSVEDVLDQHFSALPKPSQKAYLKLHNSKKTSFSRVKSIYFSNCYDLGKADTGSLLGGSAIGLLASRINHSCIPNVQFSFADEAPAHLVDLTKEIDPNTTHTAHQNQGLMLFYTLRNLPAHREVLANYDSIFMGTEQRQVKQQMYYGFRCKCEACTGTTEFWGRSDERRREMSKLKAQIDGAEKSWTRFQEQASDRNGHAVTTTITVTAAGGKSEQVAYRDGDAVEPGRRLAAANQHDIAMGVIPALERLATLLAKEGIAGVDLARTYRALSTWSRRAKSDAEARSWLEREYDTCVTVFGRQGRQTVEVDRQRRI